MIKLYRTYTIIPSSRLTGQYEEKDMRIDWICYLRDEPVLPYRYLIRDYDALKESGEDMNWIHQRANNFLTREEVEELRKYLNLKYGFDLESEEFEAPIHPRDLPWFKEKYVNSTIILRDQDDPFSLSLCILGMVSPIRDLNTVQTVDEFLREIDRHYER